jgi:uncharacterized membrane protein YhhN
MALPYFYFAFSMLVLIFYALRLKKLTPKKRLVFKMINSSNFLILAIISFLFNNDFDPTLFLLIIFSLIFGFIGDFFLGLMNLYSAHKGLYFKLGCLSFLLGHLVYLYLFAGSVDHIWLYYLIVVLTLLAIIFLTFKKLQISFGKHRLIAGAYMVIIISTFFAVAFYLFLNKTIFSTVFFIGFLFFLTSDVLLSFIYFGNLKPRTLITFRLLNALFYFSGQLFIALSLLFL